jgi:helicase
MRRVLSRWVSDADALRYLNDFRVVQRTTEFAHIRTRPEDYYISLVGELFDRLRQGYDDAKEWARLGNAFAQIANETTATELRDIGVSADEPRLFAATAFYYGGFPASAYITIRERIPETVNEIYLTCIELLGRPSELRSETSQRLIGALHAGDAAVIAEIAARASQEATDALSVGPDQWILARLRERLIDRFQATNIRAVLPNGHSDEWTPFITSLLDRTPPTWDFFPSQIEAIAKGLLTNIETFSLQMPTGAGKTTLCETLLYWHLTQNPRDAAVFLVPYRSLASELRTTLVPRLNELGIAARCAYGGTVPTGEEVQELSETRALIATPESLSGMLSADPDFFRRISLAICDEGHLLDGGGRGIGLELLLARMRSREPGPPRFVFVSAIVPNIEEINSWLGGSPESVVRSDYRPAVAEFAVLRPATRANAPVALEMHPHEPEPTRYSIANFLSRADFAWTNPLTNRQNTYGFNSVKVRAIAAARKALPMGAAAIFAANKRGDQGAVGIAEELLNQLTYDLPLPAPLQFADAISLAPAIEYVTLEYGADWVGTRTLVVGAVLHHGDIPQETREVLESLLRRGPVKLAICTTTLAEGVNFPLRTLVLYSVERRGPDGRAVRLLARDIKNLVGRTGRPGATTKGLVICANDRQWPGIRSVARGIPGETVRGALRTLVERLRGALARRNIGLSNDILEESPALHTLVDGIDSTLIDLAAEEISEGELVRRAQLLAEETFASQQTDVESRVLLQQVFELRARRVIAIRSAGRLEWVRETGTRVRMLTSVEGGLLSRRERWDDIASPLDPEFVRVLLGWAWGQQELQEVIKTEYRLGNNISSETVRGSFFMVVERWLAGDRFHEIASAANLDINDLLGIHARAVTFALQTLIEQGIALLARFLDSEGRSMSLAVAQFPEHLRYGVPTAAAGMLAAGGLRHRSAAVALGRTERMRLLPWGDRLPAFAAAERILTTERERWRAGLGSLVYVNTLADLRTVTREIRSGD